MQTFMPHGADFEATAAMLDQKRLNKQGVECYQIMRTLAGMTKGWKNHPAVLMWKGYESSLLQYTEAIYNEIDNRGYKADTFNLVVDVFNENFTLTEEPQWIHSDRLKITHRGRLWFKDPEHYWQYMPEAACYEKYVCCSHCLYFWPSHEQKKLDLLTA